MATALPLVIYSTLEEQIEALERDGYDVLLIDAGLQSVSTCPLATPPE